VLPFRKKTPPVLGIDISEAAVKLLELSHRGPNYQVESYAVEQLPSNSVAEKTINDVDAVGDTIAAVVAKSGTKTKDAAICVAGSSVITKVINMPAGLSDDDMESQIQIEAEQHIPFPLDQVAIDFEVQNQLEEGGGEVSVLLAAARSEIIDNSIAALELGGLNAKIVDIEAFTIENTIEWISRSFPSGVSTDEIAVADIGSRSMTLSVLKDLKVVYSRDESFGGHQLTEEIQRRYGMSFEEAAIAKKTGSLPEDYNSEILEPFKENLISEISRALQFFYSSSQTADIDILVVAGGCASIPHLADLIEPRLEIKTMIANPFSKMNISPKVNKKALANDAPALMIACGLAMRGGA
jgi:type IV pilus assembly protein PilM